MPSSSSGWPSGKCFPTARATSIASSWLSAPSSFPRRRRGRPFRIGSVRIGRVTCCPRTTPRENLGQPSKGAFIAAAEGRLPAARGRARGALARNRGHGSPRRADRIRSVWVGDHLLYRDATHGARGPWEAWTMLAAIAASTNRIAIGPLVACTSFHNPAMLAKLAATVDEISGGRLILGLGAGWNETEYRAYGFPFDQRVSRFAEAFTIIRSLLRDGRVEFAGEFYSARECELVPRPRPGGPPLLVGSTGDRMLAITIPYVDSWNAWYSWTGNRPDGVAPLRDKVDAACAV